MPRLGPLKLETNKSVPFDDTVNLVECLVKDVIQKFTFDQSQLDNRQPFFAPVEVSETLLTNLCDGRLGWMSCLDVHHFAVIGPQKEILESRSNLVWQIETQRRIPPNVLDKQVGAQLVDVGESVLHLGERMIRLGNRWCLATPRAPSKSRNQMRVICVKKKQIEE